MTESKQPHPKPQQIFRVLLRNMWWRELNNGTRYRAGEHYFCYETVTSGKLPSSAILLPDDDFIKDREKRIGKAQVAFNAQYTIFRLERDGKKVPAKVRKEALGNTDVETKVYD